MCSAHQRVFQQLLCTFGHFTENQGEHYMSLEQDMADYDNGEEESEESNLEELIGEYAGSQAEPTEQF